MSAFHTAFGDRDRTQSIPAPWIFAAKMLFALVLVLAATLALVGTEVLVTDPSHLGNADFLLVLQ